MNVSARKKWRIAIAAIVIIVLIGGGIYYYQVKNAPPDTILFKSRVFSFEHPRSNHVEEYTAGVVSVERTFGDTYFPLVEVVRYRNDPDVGRPASYDAFIKKQAINLCGADGPTESISCSNPVATPYTSKQGYAGEQLSLTLTRKNLKTGTTTPSVFTPVYVFNVTQTASSTDQDDSLRYQAIFVYPSLAAFVSASTSPELMTQVIDSLILPGGVTTIK